MSKNREYEVKKLFAELNRVKRMYTDKKYSVVDFESYLDERIKYYRDAAKEYDETFNFIDDVEKEKGE